MDRRSFLHTLGAAGAACALTPQQLFGRPRIGAPRYFGIHPFIESNPESVFVFFTNVDSKLNAAAKKAEGRTFATSVFVPLDSPGYPTDANVVIKPNLTCRARWHPSYTVERSMGIVTDAWFVEGMIERLVELRIAPGSCLIREVNCYDDFADGGYIDLAARTGVDVRDLGGAVGTLPPGSIQWVDVPDGVWFKRIPYLWPINSRDSVLINVAKFKTHLMGVTGCAKNLQGTIAAGYVSHCTRYGVSMSVAPEDIQPNANAVILDNYLRHVADRVPRWDRPGHDGGLRQETWASRCLDNNSVTKPALHIMEGIYGRDGHFMDGPSTEGLATDYMTNFVLFGKNAFNVDIIAHWLAGHEPGNFGLFHMAVERGLARTVNPMNIPLFVWTSGSTASLRPLPSMSRTPLQTNFLRRDYDGQEEPYWHLVNEPYNYPTSARESPAPVPREFTLDQNFPNPFNGQTSIQFTIRETGAARLDVVNIHGEVVDVLAEGTVEAGPHLVRWNANGHASGVYFCRLRSRGIQLIRTMVLIR